MWTQPRATIQQIVFQTPGYLILLLAVGGEVFRLMRQARSEYMGDEMNVPDMAIYVVIYGTVLGLVTLYLAGAMLRWTGRWLGGVATSEDLYCAIAWSKVPMLWVALLWIPQWIFFGEAMFMSPTPEVDIHPWLGPVRFSSMLVERGVDAWVCVVLLENIGGVQGFSKWKALLNVVLAMVVPVVLAMLVFIGFVETFVKR